MILILAPAKLNLGLEILGRRDDGFHEIRTVFCAVSLFDRISVEQAAIASVSYKGGAEFSGNLVGTAINLATTAVPDLRPVKVEVEKRIPIAAGLGGASSDAAAALLALSQLNGNSIAEERLAAIAVQSGSDVPFFLRSGLALGSSRGEHVQALQFQPLHAVVISPRASLPDKTRSMYRRISSADWTEGERIQALAASLDRGLPIDPSERLPNAFRRPLYHLMPKVAELAAGVESLTGKPVQVSGAGPSLYVICVDAEDAQSCRRSLRAAIHATTASVFTVRSVSSVLMSESPDV